jgi:hypothetical protein
MILPGNATLKVQSRPCVGLKTAVGFVVSTATAAPLTFSLPLIFALASLLRFRFYSRRQLKLQFLICKSLTFALVSPLPILMCEFLK